MIINMSILHVMMLEGMYLWAGAPLTIAAICCFAAIILISCFTDINTGVYGIVFFTVVLSLLVIAPNLNFISSYGEGIPSQISQEPIENSRNPIHATKMIIYQTMVLGQALLYYLPIFIKPANICTRWWQYLLGILLFPVLTVAMPIMLVVSFSNVHDVSWSGRPTHSANTSAQGRQQAARDSEIRK